MEPISLTLGQKFEIEKFSREIDSSDDILQLRTIAKDLLIAWKQQQAASAWALRQSQGLYPKNTVTYELFIDGARSNRCLN